MKELKPRLPDLNSERMIALQKACVVIGSVMLTPLIVWEINHRYFDRASDSQLAEISKEHYRDLNRDPRFRATSLTITTKNELGSGSLAEANNGSYELVTVEHVARPIYDLKTIAGNEVITAQLGDNKKSKPNSSVFIPGLGHFPISKNGAKPKLVGYSKPKGPQDMVDRVAVIPLDKAIKEAVAKADKAGVLKIPEIAPFKAKFGEQFFMPLEDTGKNIPFVYMDRAANGDPQLIPLVLLNRNLDYKAGMKFLKREISKYQGVPEKYFGVLPATFLPSSTMQVTQKLVTSMDLRDQKKADALTEWLPCRGDSGSPLLDAKGNIVAVISAVQYFQNNSILPFGVLSRHGEVDPNQTCGWVATFSPMVSTH